MSAGAASGRLVSLRPDPRPEQDSRGRFVSGNIGGGRPKGARNKLGEEFLADLSADFEKHGAAAIERVREEDPATYIRVIASLLPKELKVERSRYEDMSEEEIDGAILRASRLLEETIKA